MKMSPGDRRIVGNRQIWRARTFPNEALISSSKRATKAVNCVNYLREAKKLEDSMATSSKSVLSRFLVGLLFLVSGPLVGSLCAEDGKRVEASPPYPGGSEIAFEWQYSCGNGKGCSFNCSGSGGASNVTKLSIHLMTIPLGAKNVPGIFYEYSTVDIPRANGFNITTGISTLACQVNGMNLDYSGLPKNKPSDVISRLSR
jgi:hypothetical protein